jgi:hypothetical protein
VTASAAPPAEEVVVNLIAGYCLSEKMGTPLPAGSIDPRKTGTRLTPSDRLARLSSKALRVATASGDVYYDYNETYCYAHASGVDRARTIVRLEDELKRLSLTFHKNSREAYRWANKGRKTSPGPRDRRRHSCKQSQCTHDCNHLL